MSVELIDSKNFLDILGIIHSEKKMERLYIIDEIKRNPEFINTYAQQLHNLFDIKYEDISTHIRTELVAHGLPKHFLDEPLDSKFKDTQKRNNRLQITDDLKMASNFKSIMSQN